MQAWLERLVAHMEWASRRALRVVREAVEGPVNTDFIQFVRTGPGGAE